MASRVRKTVVDSEAQQLKQAEDAIEQMRKRRKVRLDDTETLQTHTASHTHAEFFRWINMFFLFSLFTTESSDWF